MVRVSASFGCRRARQTSPLGDSSRSSLRLASSCTCAIVDNRLRCERKRPLLCSCFALDFGPTIRLKCAALDVKTRHETTTNVGGEGTNGQEVR